MTHITPTIGRVVHFHPSLSFQQRHHQPGGILAAIITDVLNNNLINLIVFGCLGDPIPTCHVRLVQNDETVLIDNAVNNYATWMPYQLGQAAKHEEQSTTHDVPRTQYIVVTGNPFDGIAPHGPFFDHDEALEWADDVEDVWVITELNPP